MYTSTIIQKENKANPFIKCDDAKEWTDNILYILLNVLCYMCLKVKNVLNITKKNKK